MKRLMVAAVLAAAGLVSSADYLGATDADVLRFVVDVSEDFDGKFVSTPVNPADTEPKRGSWFLTEGNIFPAFTIQADGSTFDPGSAGAIGRWICRGTHLVSLTDILNGAPLWVATQQTYQLPSDRRTITTDGTEGSVPLVRAVTGGTGIFRGYVGEQHQQFLGLNAKNGVNLRVTFVLRRAAR
jgi:hypothetical protein